VVQQANAIQRVGIVHAPANRGRWQGFGFFVDFRFQNDVHEVAQLQQMKMIEHHAIFIVISIVVVCCWKRDDGLAKDELVAVAKGLALVVAFQLDCAKVVVVVATATA